MSAYNEFVSSTMSLFKVVMNKIGFATVRDCVYLALLVIDKLELVNKNSNTMTKLQNKIKKKESAFLGSEGQCRSFTRKKKIKITWR